MKKLVIKSLLMFLLTQVVYSQEIAYIKIRSEVPLKDSLVLTTWDSFVHLGSKYGSQEYRFLPDTTGIVEFAIPDPSYAMRIRIVNSSIGLVLPFGLVEAGDRITITINKVEGKHANVSFSGVGCAKYQFLNEIKHLKQEIDHIWLNSENRQCPKCLANEFKKLNDIKLSKLDSYRDYLSDTAYQILKLDLIGILRYYELMLFSYNYAETNGILKGEFEVFMQKLIEEECLQDNTDQLALSKGYVEYLYYKEKTGLVYRYSPNFNKLELSLHAPYSFQTLYDRLDSNYFGSLRDRLLTYCLVHPTDILKFFQEFDANEYEFCMERALHSMTTPAMIHLVKREKEARTRGNQAFNFELPDENGQVVQLGDFEGKIVLLDFWGTGCGACLIFKQKFEKEVYPELKNNPDFIFVSINTDRKKEAWLRSLPIYSNKDFVNLSLYGLGHYHPIFEYYNIKSLPFILLIGKSGQLISSTVPHESNALLDLINSQLN